MAALRERDGGAPSGAQASEPGSGEGQFVDVSMADGSLSWLAMVAGAYFADGEVPRRGDLMLAGAAICYRPYECADGWVTLGALEPKFFAAFCSGVGREDLIAKQFERPGSEAHAQLVEIFKGRTQGMGILSADQAISYGVTGPNLRASGVPFDVRKAHPYSIYDELEFDVITQQRGDVYARYLQRIAEIKQSLHLIDQIMDKMPHGPVQAQVPGIIRPKPGRAYGAVESPRGLYSVYAISDGGPTPYRFRMRDPSFITLQVMPMLMPGHLIADTMAIMASLDPVMGGVDK